MIAAKGSSFAQSTSVVSQQYMKNVLSVVHAQTIYQVFLGHDTRVGLLKCQNGYRDLSLVWASLP